MTLRAVFHEEDDALAVAARLRRDGFEATLARDRFAGEDDDEDHPWAVATDAPEYLLDLLVEEHDGWLDHGDRPPGTSGRPGAVPPAAPLELPDGPRRVKGHFRD